MRFSVSSVGFADVLDQFECELILSLMEIAPDKPSRWAGLSGIGLMG